MGKKQGNSTRCVHAGDTPRRRNRRGHACDPSEQHLRLPGHAGAAGAHLYAPVESDPRRLREGPETNWKGEREPWRSRPARRPSSAVLELLEPGDHIIGPRQRVRRQLQPVAHGGRGPASRSATYTRTRALTPCRPPGAGTRGWCGWKRPSNPLMRITDLKALSALCAERGALSCVDSTLATPLATQPLSLGCDIFDALDYQVRRRALGRAGAAP